jgi:uncharacterized protein DUF433
VDACAADGPGCGFWSHDLIFQKECLYHRAILHSVLVDRMKTTFEGFDRITADPAVLEGKPCIRGMRLCVQRVLDILTWTLSIYFDRR